jgi:hypothetical protein
VVSIKIRFSGCVKDQSYCWSLLPTSQSDIHHASSKLYILLTRCEGLRMLQLKIRVSWDVTRCHWVSGYWCFEGTHCVHLQAQAVHCPKWRYKSSKHHKPHTQQHSITPQKTWFFVVLVLFMIMQWRSRWYSFGIMLCIIIAVDQILPLNG